MRHMNGFGVKTLLSAFALAFALGGMSGCGAPQPVPDGAETQEAAEAVDGDVTEDADDADDEVSAELQEAYDEALLGEDMQLLIKLLLIQKMEAMFGSVCRTLSVKLTLIETI